MSEITKLYENCNIKLKQEGHCDWDSNCPYPRLKCNDECPYWKDEDEAKYPPFTAEKQLSLIKWLVCTGKEIRISGHRKGDLFWMSTDVDNKEQESTFEETLVKLINNIWQDLTEEEKQQVKGILE